MARKRKGSFWASTFAILYEGPANDFVEAIEFAAIHELVNLGYDVDVIETWVPYGRYPSEKWLQKKIDELESINPDALEPLSPKSYQRRISLSSAFIAEPSV